MDEIEVRLIRLEEHIKSQEKIEDAMKEDIAEVKKDTKEILAFINKNRGKGMALWIFVTMVGTAFFSFLFSKLPSWG